MEHMKDGPSSNVKKDEKKKMNNINSLAFPSFKLIRRNVYVDCKERIDNGFDPCRCLEEAGSCITDSCSCRSIFVECSKLCKCGKACENQRIRKGLGKKVEKFLAGSKGLGLKTRQDILKDEFIVEFVGEVITSKENCRRNKQQMRWANTHQYPMQLTGGLVIDATSFGNAARFINHSCDPNCRAEKWMVEGRHRLAIVANRNISKGEELTLDYGYAGKPFDEIPCLCNSSKCRKFLGRPLSKSRKISKT
ncbi:Histone-lysine N-methyltransferase ash1 [Trichinella pseudospiralis]|uniref:Histone-lysine N-methyltransferase ash1 n=2 Tax=Trichinella pseudospiralis TaxID=6337 RepID=A0A0V0XQD2_TRIPS|nr:Histone-lysine N-methyltransferase ash1 [Trichinella pseudospiralis]KRY85232.1 Histone-lysine N-methyltransferase ash1 [Trichinella pseudospiralis]KRZ22439.1 Histone-lysine N-methyltransferase ash1 [Trichinella pseudospiralis]KRZ36626.1 Histone-lysine N-methyltransferase ash1 [Trichinella pseudospiralis]